MNPTILTAGARIDGRYELVNCLGVCDTGEVWRANDARLDMRPVAVKVLKTDFMTRPEVIARFEAEVDALLHRVREITPQVIDRGALDDLRYVVTELPNEASLRALLDAPPAISKTVAMDVGSLPASSFGAQPMGAFPPPTPYGPPPPMGAFPPPTPYGSPPSNVFPSGGVTAGAPVRVSPWPAGPVYHSTHTQTSSGSGVFSGVVIGALFVGLLVSSGVWFAMRKRTSTTHYSTVAPLPPPQPPAPLIRTPPRPTRPPEDPDRIYIVRDNPAAPSLGPRSAPVTVVSFSDFQCPFCARVVPTLDRLRAQYGDQVRVVWRDYPLAFHANAMPAAEAAREVLRQRGDDAFWRYHAMLFENQRALTVDDLARYADAVGASGSLVRRALAARTHQAAVRDDMAAFDASGARAGTPAFFINGRMLRGAQPFERFAAAVDRALREGVERK